MFRALPIAVAAAAFLIATAGGSAAPSAAAPVTLEVDDTGITVPARVAGGLTTMRFRNAGTRLHEFAMGRADDGRGVAEVRGALRRVARGAPLPPWIRDVAGPGNMTSGAEVTVTRRLRPGVYVVFDGVPDRRGVPGVARGISGVFRVVGRTTAAAPATDGVVEARAGRFAVPELPGGIVTLELRNTTRTPREFRLTSLRPGSGAADVGRWVAAFESTGRLPRGPSPLTMLGAVQSIPPRTSVYVTVRLDAGREYALGDDRSGALTRFTPR